MTINQGLMTQRQIAIRQTTIEHYKKLEAAFIVDGLLRQNVEFDIDELKRYIGLEQKRTRVTK